MLSSIEELYIVLLWIVPGFFGYTVYRIFAIDEKERSDFDKVIYMLVYSLVSYQVINAFIFKINTFEDIQNNIYNPTFTLALFATPTLLGFVGGELNHLLFGRQIISKDCWINISKKVGREWVTVYTKDGLEIEGVLNYIGREYVDKELIITNPNRVIRDEKLTVEANFSLGEEMYFNKDDISRIAFKKHF